MLSRFNQANFITSDDWGLSVPSECPHSIVCQLVGISLVCSVPPTKRADHTTGVHPRHPRNMCYLSTLDQILQRSVASLCPCRIPERCPRMNLAVSGGNSLDEALTHRHLLFVFHVGNDESTDDQSLFKRGFRIECDRACLRYIDEFEASEILAQAPLISSESTSRNIALESFRRRHHCVKSCALHTLLISCI